MTQPTLSVKDSDGDTHTLYTISPNGQATAADSRSVVLASDHASVPVKTAMAFVGVEFIRPSDTTAYTVNDVIGPTTTPANINFENMLSANGGTGYVVMALLSTNNEASAAATRLYLYNEDPTPIADNSQFTIEWDDNAAFLGYIDFPALQRDGTASTAAISQWTGQIPVKAAAADRDLYGVLVIKSGETPESAQKFYVKLTVDQN